MWKFYLIVLLSIFVAAGCGEEDPEPRNPGGGLNSNNSGHSTNNSSGGDSEFEGLYDITSWTLNEEACDAEGDAREEQDELLRVIACDSSLIGEYLMVETCADEASCDELDCESFGWTFDGGSDADGWEGATTFTGFSTADDQCEDPEYSPRELAEEGDGLRIEIRTQVGETYPADSEGFCTSEAARASADEAPCSKFEVIEAQPR